MSAPHGPYKPTPRHGLPHAHHPVVPELTKGRTMNDTLSLAADIATLLGVFLNAALELHRARRTARDDNEPPQK